jgi:hypothetical protein
VAINSESQQFKKLNSLWAFTAEQTTTMAKPIPTQERQTLPASIKLKHLSP